MGYECGFSAIRRYKDISFEDMKAILNYLEWKNNPWNFESDDHYPTYEKYWKTFLMDNFLNEGVQEEYPGEPTDKEAIEFYQQYYNSDHTLNFWCSIGYECLDEYMIRNLTQVKQTEDWIGIDRDFITSTYHWAYKELDKYRLIDLYPINSIRNTDDEDSVILTKIDGVEMKDDHDKVYRIYNNEYCDSSIHYSADLSRKYCLEEFIQTLDFIKFLNKQDDYFIWFWRSY
jgi:hypothetical protein